MRQWLGIGLLVVIVVAILSFMWFVRKEHEDSRFQTALATYRSALKPGTSRERVEDYLRQQGLPFERSCCEPGVFSDRAKIGQEEPNWVCRNRNIYLEFKFQNSAATAAVASGSDVLTKIDLYQNGICL
jgi:IS5 family transposase